MPRRRRKPRLADALEEDHRLLKGRAERPGSLLYERLEIDRDDAGVTPSIKESKLRSHSKEKD